MNFTPSTEKQKGMLGHQLRESHEGAFERTDLDRELVEEIKRYNEQGDLDKWETSTLIEIVLDYNNARYEMNPILIKRTNAMLRQVQAQVIKRKSS